MSLGAILFREKIKICICHGEKTSLLIIMILGSLNLIYSQNEYKNKTNSSNRQDSLSQVNTKIKPQPEHVYVIFTSKEYDPESEHGITEGVMRIETCYPYTNDMALISYTFLSRSKNFDIAFLHWNLKREELKRPTKSTDKMNIVMMSKDFLLTVNPIDLDKKGPSMTREEALELRERLVGKIIWIIDRRDIVSDSVKLIQTETRVPVCF